jgi:hypothetical protein
LHNSYLVKKGILIPQKFKRFLIAKTEVITNKNRRRNAIQKLLKFQQIAAKTTQIICQNTRNP